MDLKAIGFRNTVPEVYLFWVMFSCVWNFKASASLFMSGTSVSQWLAHQEALQLSCCWLWSSPEHSEPAFNSLDQKSSRQKHSRPQKPFLALPLTYSIMLYSKCKQISDRNLNKNWQQVHTISTSIRWISYTPYSPMNKRLCFMSPLQFSPQIICCS